MLACTANRRSRDSFAYYSAAFPYQLAFMHSNDATAVSLCTGQHQMAVRALTLAFSRAFSKRLPTFFFLRALASAICGVGRGR